MFDGREPVRDYRFGPLIKNIYFQCDIRKSKIEAQAYIDFCIGSANKDEGRKRNLEYFKRLLTKKLTIEAKFGGSLVWDDGKRKNEDRDYHRCKIMKVFEGRGLTSPQTDWPEMCDKLIDAIVRLEEVLKPYNI
jgi:hypothetical protein